jgi:hypothetical protein
MPKAGLKRVLSLTNLTGANDANDLSQNQGQSKRSRKNNAAVTKTNNDDLQQQIHDLKKIVSSQEQTIISQDAAIKTLSTKLDFVMSMFDIPNVTNDQLLLSAQSQSASYTSCVAGSSSSVDWPDLPTRDGQTTKQGPNTVVKARVAPAVQFKRAVLSAVYTDSQAKASRAKSFIVKGLTTRQNCTDKDLVVNLCSTELNILPSIAYCKRLGVPVSGRVQPLLTVLTSAEQASKILTDAKHLRISSDSVTRQQVYISENLTKAEAQAAYEMRCKRRQAALHRNPQKLGEERSFMRDQAATDSVTVNQLPTLNAEASSFQPTAVSE